MSATLLSEDRRKRKGTGEEDRAVSIALVFRDELCYKLVLEGINQV